MPIVRTTFRPDQTIEVDDVEYQSLRKQGLLIEAPAPAAVPAVPATPKKTTGVTGSKEN